MMILYQVTLYMISNGTKRTYRTAKVTCCGQWATII